MYIVYIIFKLTKRFNVKQLLGYTPIQVFFQNILKVAVPTVLTHASWTVTISATPLPVPHRPAPTLSTPRVSAAPCVRMTAPTEPVRSTTGPCVTPYPVPTRRVRIPSPPPGIAVRTVPQVCIMRVYCFSIIVTCTCITWFNHIVLLHICTLLLIIISRGSFVITIICWLKRKINSYTLCIYTYVYLFYKYHNIARTSKPPLNAIKIKANKHQRKTPRQLKNMINTIYSNLVTISFSKKDNSHFFPITWIRSI